MVVDEVLMDLIKKILLEWGTAGKGKLYLDDNGKIFETHLDFIFHF